MRTRTFALALFLIAFSMACSLSQLTQSTQPKSTQSKIPVAQGGTLNLGDQVKVNIPRTALSKDQTVSITQLSEKPAAGKESITIPGVAYEIKAEQEFFRVPIEITIHYDDALLPKGRSEGEIFGVFQHEGKWRKILGKVDKEKNTLTLRTIHASVWTWAFDSVVDASFVPASTALNCIQNAINPNEVPKTLFDAYQLQDKRLREWDQVTKDARLNFAQLDASFQKQLRDMGFDWIRKVPGEIVEWQAEMFIEHLLEVPHMEKLLVVKTAKGIIGVIDLVEGVLVSLETSALSGEVLAEATKIKAAQQRYMASKAYVYLFENPDAKTIPPEYVVALLATCSKTPEVNQPAPGTTQIRNSAIDGASMVFVPAGDFLMGSGDADKNARAGEKPQHTVYLDAFWIDKFEVTNALYKKCVDAGKCAKPKEIGSYTRNSYYGNPQFDNHPVIYVSWDNATQYCAWAGKRLPTEAQWEKAARGTDGRIYPWGNVFDKNKLNSSDGGNRDTIAVGNFSSGVSPYGAMDMAGNVWEWVADWYDEKYYANSPRNNPKGPSSGQYRVFRGGSYNNGANDARAVYRNSYNARWYSNMGFRCVE